MANAQVCKTCIRGFNSRPVLQSSHSSFTHRLARLFVTVADFLRGRPFAGLRIGGGEDVLLHSVDQGAAAYVEMARGLGLIAFELIQGTADELALDLFAGEQPD